MATTAEAQVGKGSLLLVALRAEAVRLEAVGVLEDALQTRGHRGGGDDDVALGDGVGHAVQRGGDVLHRLTHEHDERREHAKRLLHAVLQVLHVAHAVEVESLALAQQSVLLGEHLLEAIRVVQEKHHRPGGGDTRSVLASKEQGDQQTHDLVVGEVGLVLAVHEVDVQLQDVGVMTGVLAGLALVVALLDHAREDLHHLLACVVTHGVGLRGGVGEEERQRGHTLVEVVVDTGHLREHVLTDLITVQAARRSKNSKLRQGLKKVNGARVAPLLDIVESFFLDLRNVRFEAAGLQALGHTLHLLNTLLWLGIIDNTSSKHRSHKLIDFRLRHLIVSQLVERCGHLRLQQKGEVLVQHRNSVDRSEFLTSLFDEFNGILGKLDVVSDQRSTDGRNRRSALSAFLSEESVKDKEGDNRGSYNHNSRHFMK
mmetsp:Transcript_49332/g.86199  ORF Transcript_49332/g.86199 Transcript_49332/m.86199 type:complete len:428 (+) Transcript_49332:304-1587(+)